MGSMNAHKIAFIILLLLLITTNIEPINDICVDFPDHQTRNFGRSGHDNTTEVISFIDAWNPPDFIYHGSKICGPLAKILVELSKQYGYSLKRIPYPRDISEFYEAIMNEKWSLALFPITPGIYEALSKYELDGLNVLSRPLGTKSEGHILSKVRPGKRNIFEFLLGFDTPVWIAILLTILFIPLALALVKKTFSDYMADLWNYTYLILSEVIPRIPTSSTQRFIIIFWLLGCTVLLAGYAGVIRGFFITSTPDDVVDSWEDLHNRKDLKIVTTEGSVINEFAEKECGTSEMAADFKSRMKFINLIDLIPENIRDSLYGHDDYAASFYNYLMEDCYFWLPKGRNRADCEKFHVSKHGGVTVPYFLALSYRMSAKSIEHLNKIISRSIESGLYEKWLTESQRVRKLLYPDEKYTHKPKIDSEVIRLESISGVFIILFVGITISFAVLMVEIIFRQFRVY